MSERSVAVLVPVLNRPQLVAGLVESLDGSVAHERGEGWQVEVVFVCSPNDHVEIAAVQKMELDPLVAQWPPGPGDYARKINHAARYAIGELGVTWVFTGADDLRFHPGWLAASVRRHVRTGALVVGTNDLGNPYVMRGLYATHLFVHREWVARGTVDEPGLVFHEGYDHNCVDTELVETAKARRQFAFARDAHVEHLHPSWKKAVDDATYRKGRKNHHADRQLLNQRRPLWQLTRRKGRVVRGLR